MNVSMAVSPSRRSLLRSVGVLLLTMLASTVFAQSYSERQVLHATPQGEGAPDLHFGGAVAIDGDLAVVSEIHLDSATTLRGYRRVNGVWQRASELTIDVSNESVIAIALSEGALIYSVVNLSSNSRTVRVMRASATGWVQSYAINSVQVGFGNAVAIAGDRALIGHPAVSNLSGAVYVVERISGNTWSNTATLVPTTPQQGAQFGSSVAIVSGAVVIGAVTEDVNSGGLLQGAGAAYVFELTQTTWNQVNRLVAPTPLTNGRFGTVVAISGLDEGTPDRLLISSQETSSNGRVYAYRRGASNWVSSFVINPPTVQSSQLFGTSLSMDGDYAVIGAHLFDLGGTDTGVVYGVDFNVGFTAATLLQRSDPLQEVGAFAGYAVAIDRDGPSMLVGAPLAASNGNDEQGVVLMSVGSAGTPFPLLQRVFDLGQGLGNARFGSAVSTQGDLLLVGAPGESVGNNAGIGAAYLFRRQLDGQYALETRWQSPQGGVGDSFGTAVAVHGDIALIGAPGIDVNGTDSGVVYVYRRSNGNWNIEALIHSQCASTDRRDFGRRIAFDGTHAMLGGICPPVSMGGPSNDVGVVIATRQSDGNWIPRVDTYSSRMGAGGWDAGMAIIGNPNIRGSADAIEAGFVRTATFNGTNWVGAGPSDNGSNTPTPQGYGYGLSVDQGVLAIASYRPNTPVIVRRRVGNNFLPEISLVPSGLIAADATQAVAVQGDRIAIGAPMHTVSVDKQGAAFVFERRLGVWQQTQRLVASNPESFSYFASTMSFAADGSLIVGAPEESPMFAYEGVVYVYALPPDLMHRDGFE